MRSQGYHHSSPGLPEFTTVTRVPVLTGATVDEFAAIGAAVPARASPGPATPTAAGTRSGIAGSNAPCSTYAGMSAEMRDLFRRFDELSPAVKPQAKLLLRALLFSLESGAAQGEEHAA